MRRYSGSKDRLDAAQNPSTDPMELAALATSEYGFVREAVSANPTTPLPVLPSLIPDRLRTEEDFMIVAALLRNRKLTAALCETLIEKVASVAEGISPRAFYATMAFERLFEHPAAPIASPRALLIRKSFPKYFRARTAAPHARRDVLECLLSDESERVRRRATRVLLSRIRAVDPVVEHANEGS